MHLISSAGDGFRSNGRRFCLNMHDATARVWRRRGGRYASCCVRQTDRWGGGRVMVRGGIYWRHKASLIVVDGRHYMEDVMLSHS